MPTPLPGACIPPGDLLLLLPVWVFVLGNRQKTLRGGEKTVIHHADGIDNQ